MNNLIFEGNDIRLVLIDGEPWWVLADLCRALELADAGRTAARLDEDEKGTHTVSTLGGPQEVLIISEPGLYRILHTSRKPVAKRFVRWNNHEVLPSIRKTGNYLAPSSDLVVLSQSLVEGMRQGLRDLGTVLNLKFDDFKNDLKKEMITRGELNQFKCEVMTEVVKISEYRRKNRKNFNEEVEAAYWDVDHRFFNGVCRFPGCCTKIVDEHSQPIERGTVASIDHLHGPLKTSWSDGLPVCMTHNHEMERPGVRTRAEVQRAISTFQEMLRLHHPHLIDDEKQFSLSLR